MLQRMLIGAAISTALLSATPAMVSAQPPTPPQIVHKIDRGVHHAVTSTDRALRNATHRTRYRAHHVYYHRVRAVCNDGRVHIGRTPFTACYGHGGFRG